jgi:PPM family protein phosphatase
MLASGGLFAVADGMGGHAAGEIASALAVAGLQRLSERPTFTPDDVRAELTGANDAILASVGEYPERHGMGTTIAGAALTSIAGTDHWVVFNVGDSRVYRFLDGTLVQMTVDHTEVADLVAAGTISPADASTHPSRHVVTRVLGSDPAPEPDVWVFPPTPGERLLICSDGLFSEVTDREVAAVLGAAPQPQGAADELIRRASAYGRRDDVTVIVVDCAIDTASADSPFDDTLPRARRGERAG